MINSGYGDENSFANPVLKTAAIELFRHVSSARMTLLYAEAGRGKAVLLQDYLLPLLKKEGTFYPILIQMSKELFPAALSPREMFMHAVRADPNIKFNDTLKGPDSLWAFLRSARAPGRLVFLLNDIGHLFMDFPLRQVEEFMLELQELLSDTIPQWVHAAIADIPRNQRNPAIMMWQEPLLVNFLMSCDKDDRVSLEDCLPGQIDRSFNLDALPITAAWEYIASVTGISSPTVIKEITDYLKQDAALNPFRNTGETLDFFHVEIICTYLSRCGENEAAIISSVPGLIKDYYINQNITPEITKALLAHLLKGGRRMMVPATALMACFSPEQISMLQSRRILQKIRYHGGTAFRLYHPMLITQIREAPNPSPDVLLLNSSRQLLQKDVIRNMASMLVQVKAAHKKRSIENHFNLAAFYLLFFVFFQIELFLIFMIIIALNLLFLEAGPIHDTISGNTDRVLFLWKVIHMLCRMVASEKQIIIIFKEYGVIILLFYINVLITSSMVIGWLLWKQLKRLGNEFSGNPPS